MPIQVKAPDGSIAQFPDGMSDDAITAVMQREYPQPSYMDRVAGSPGGRAVQANLVSPVLNGLSNLVSPLSQLGGVGNTILRASPLLSAFSSAGQVGDKAFSQSVAHNQNTPGYHAARVEADKVTAANGGSGFSDQMLSTLAPSLAGTTGLIFGGSDSANAAADSQQAAQDKYKQENPVKAFVGNVLGGMLLAPSGTAAKVPSYTGDNALITRMGQGPGASISPRPALPDPAIQYVGNLAASAGKSPADLAALPTKGKPLTAAEAIGKPGEVGLGALARRDGSTADAMAAQISGRQADAPGRILDDFSAVSGIDPAAARGDLKAFVDNGRAQAGPLYDEAYAQAPVITDRLNRFATDPLVQKGMREGIRTEQLKALAAGKPFDPSSYAVTRFNEAGDPIIGPVPTWKSWDAAKVGIDDILEQYRDKTTGRLVLDKRGSAINDVRKAMLNELDAVNPAYKTARAAAGDYLSAQNSFDNGGRMLLNGNLPVSDFVKHFSGLDPADQQAFVGGAANNLFNLAQNGKLTPRVFNRPIIQQKLATILGPDKAQQFVDALQTEARMAGFARTRVPGAGSPTAEYQAAMADQDALHPALSEGVDYLSQVASKGPIKGSIAYGAGKAKDAAAAYATRGMPGDVRDRAGQLLMLPPSDFAAQLSAYNPLPRGPLHLPKITKQSKIPIGLLPLLVQNQAPPQR